MNWKDACAVVVPCFNEEQTLQPLLLKIKAVLPHIIVVDDGSTDATPVMANQTGVKTLQHPGNKGKGAALRTGLSYAHSKGFQWAITMDGDGQHLPEDIGQFLNCAGTTGAHLIVGNRMNDLAGMSLLRRWVNRLMSWLLSMRTGQNLPDSQCGFRLINLDAWASLMIRSDHFEVESETLTAFARNDYILRFVPIQTIKQQRQSRIHPLRDTWRWLKWWRKGEESSSQPCRELETA